MNITNIYQLHSKPSTLLGYKDMYYIVPELAFRRIMDLKRVFNYPTSERQRAARQRAGHDPNPKITGYDTTIERLERGLAQNPYYAYAYAKTLPDRFLLGEPAMARDPVRAAEYTIHINKQEKYADKPWRFVEAEPTIAQSPWYSYLYAVAIGERFPAGEPAIARNAYESYKYAKDVLKHRFELGEPAILNASTTSIVFNYAKEIVKEPWPELESRVLESLQPELVYHYARSVMRRPWDPNTENGRIALDIINNSKSKFFVRDSKTNYNRWAREWHAGKHRKT